LTAKPDAVAAGAPSEEEPDGRRRRSLDSRARIVAAMLELIRAGHTAPGAEQVAERAGVGLRTVFRHFKDMASLYREMSRVIEDELQDVADRPFRGRTWRERILELVERRAVGFEKIAPFKRASDVQRLGARLPAADQRRLNAALRGILERELPPEVAADAVKVEALDLLLSFESWDRLRSEQGLSSRRARAVLERAVRGVIGG